jgi:PAS domain S-box-containing protein
MEQIADRMVTELLEAAPDAMVCVDGRGRIAFVNAEAEQLFGYPRAELAGQPVEILVPDSARHLHPRHRDRYMARPRRRPMGAGMDLAARRKDGTTFPAEICLSAIHTDQGILITAAVRDITERRRAAETTARLAAIIESSHDAVISKTTGHVITSWNPGAERLYGYTASEMIGQHVSVLIPAEDRDRETKVLDSVARGMHLESYQTQRVRKDGTPVAVSVTLSPITDSTGTVTGIATIARDLTDKQRADARFTGLLEAAPDAMVCVDTHGRIALVNAQAEGLFGYTKAELTGEPVEILVPETVRGGHPRHRDAYLADPRPRAMGAGLDLAARRKDGTTFCAEISLSAIHTDQGTLITAAVRDVTDRLDAQAERERLIAQSERDRLERQLHVFRRLESLGQLAGGVAHDFNNLLGVITSYTSILRGETPERPLSSEQIQAHISQIEQAAKSAAGLTRQLLAFARQEVGRPRVLNLNDLISKTQHLLVRTLGEHIELAIDLEPGLSPVLADAGQLEQVLVNLAVNARDAMPTGGRLQIRTSHLSIQTPAQGPEDPPTGRYVCLKVSDTGTGIPREIIDRVFEPFFTTKPEGEGTGLGLATAYGIITAAGGRLKIYSEPGLGTTITALLPVTDQRTDAAAAPPTARPRLGKGETILLVEDAAALREATRYILTGHGYHVIEAADGPQALTILNRYTGPIHLLLTDVVMPHMPGKELASKVCAANPGIPVLFMSGYTQGILSSQGVLEPGINLIEKPFDQEALLTKVSELLTSAN